MKGQNKVDVSLKTLSNFRQRFFNYPIRLMKSVDFFFVSKP